MRQSVGGGCSVFWYFQGLYIIGFDVFCSSSPLLGTQPPSVTQVLIYYNLNTTVLNLFVSTDHLLGMFLYVLSLSSHMPRWPNEKRSKCVYNCNDQSYLSPQFKNIQSFIYSLVLFNMYGGYMHIMNSQCNQLSAGLIGQLAEYCTSIAEVMGLSPLQA